MRSILFYRGYGPLALFAIDKQYNRGATELRNLYKTRDQACKIKQQSSETNLPPKPYGHATL